MRLKFAVPLLVLLVLVGGGSLVLVGVNGDVEQERCLKDKRERFVSKEEVVHVEKLRKEIRGTSTKRQGPPTRTWSKGGLLKGSSRKFKYLDYAEIEQALKDLEEKYPDLVEVFDAQSRYGVKSPGDCGVGPCKQYVLRITNERTLPDPDRPEVFFSGEVHGNERIGPTTTIELAKLLVESYYNDCGDNLWLQRLVDTRVIVIMPTANALGYYVNRREENMIDPNRDFPIDSPSSCMRTSAARAINEVWREHLFQIALTYHGGMQAIGFEWGTSSAGKKDVSPDDNAQLMIGSTMSAYAGAFNSEGRFPHGRLNDQVYPVSGGMEDWAYAASWDGSGGCRNSDYPESKTRYEADQLRAFNILIECSTYKIPSESSLGSTQQAIRPEGEGDGHIPRNMRLALFVIDIVQPYFQWVSVSDDHKTYEWEVGGAMFVDETFLEYVYLAADGSTVKTGTTKKLSGKTRWSGGGGAGDPSNTIVNQHIVKGEDINLNKFDDIHDRDLWPFIPAFKATISLGPGEKLLNVTGKAMVDQNWKDQPIQHFPDLPPQSHIVNARTNPDWSRQNNGRQVVGRLYWNSETILLIGPEEAATSHPSPSPTETKTNDSQKPTSLPTQQQTTLSTSSSIATDENNKNTTEDLNEKVNRWGYVFLWMTMVVLVLFVAFRLYSQAREPVRYEPIDSSD